MKQYKIPENKKPKICRLTPVLFTIPGIFKGQIRHLVQSGYEVHLVTSPSPDAGGVVAEEMCIHHPVLMTRSISPFNDLMAIIRLFFLLKKIKPGILHTHTSKGGLVGMVAGKLANVPFCIHSIPGFSAFEMNSLKQKVVLACEKITFSLAHRLLPNSFSLKNFLIQHGYITEEKTDIIGFGSSNGVDLERFSKHEAVLNAGLLYRSRFGIKDNDHAFAYLGRLSSEKGINELIEAFLSIKRENIHLILIGSLESNRAFLPASVVETVNKHPRIHLTGWTNDVPGYLAAADILVHPTYHEGFPNALLQAGAMGLPCIATDVRGCQDVVEHMKTGLLVPHRDADALKKQMELLLDSPGLCRELAGNALRNIREKWDHRVVCRLLTEYYDELLGIKK
jgi:glycosyltransferase involved in cell wall biosynthesis